MGIRPEHITERSRAANPTSVIPATVDVVELLGNEIFVYLQAGPTTLTARMDPDIRLERGQQVEVVADASKLHFFDNQSELAIR